MNFVDEIMRGDYDNKEIVETKLEINNEKCVKEVSKSR